MFGYIRAKYGYYSNSGHSHHPGFLESSSLISSKHGAGSLLFQIAISKPIRILKSKSKLLPCKLYYIIAMTLPSRGKFDLQIAKILEKL